MTSNRKKPHRRPTIDEEAPTNFPPDARISVSHEFQPSPENDPGPSRVPEIPNQGPQYIDSRTFIDVKGNYFDNRSEERKNSVEIMGTWITSVASSSNAPRTEIADWLTDINFKTIQKDTISKRTSGTGSWFLNNPSFRSWQEEARGPSTLCVEGIRRCFYSSS